jgi:hypothetical protein
MDVSERSCPVCRNKNELEAVVCWHCGAVLDDPFADPGAKTKTSDMPALDPERFRGWSIDESAVPEGGIAVYAEGVFDPIFIDTTGEFVIGRKADESAEGLLDLAPLGGYHLGLSRRHAVIQQTRDGYEVLDLGSVNGTWLNNERLVPHKSYPLANGSHLRLGSMRLIVLYRRFEQQ